MKKQIKQMLWLFTSFGRQYSNYKVINGPAKGTKLILDIRKEGAYWLGNYDNWILNNLQLQNIIKPGWTIWDCGAYVGYYTAIFRKLVGEAGKVVTFEASVETYNRIKKLPELNKWKNVQILNCAVGPDHSEIRFVTNLNGGNGPYDLSKEYRETEDELTIETVKCHGVDELIDEKNIPVPDLIKFDIESAEEFALMNGDKLFTTKKPIIFLEIHGKKAFETSGEFLEKYKYKAKDISNYNESSSSIANSKDELNSWGYIPHMLFCWPE